MQTGNTERGSLSFTCYFPCFLLISNNNHWTRGSSTCVSGCCWAPEQGLDTKSMALRRTREHHAAFWHNLAIDQLQIVLSRLIFSLKWRPTLTKKKKNHKPVIVSRDFGFVCEELRLFLAVRYLSCISADNTQTKCKARNNKNNKKEVLRVPIDLTRFNADRPTLFWDLCINFL